MRGPALSGVPEQAVTPPEGAVPAAAAVASGRLWLACCAAMALGSLAGWFVPPEMLDWQPRLATAEPWRWWTAAWVHVSREHLATNLAALAVIAAFGRVARLPPVMALAWVASWPLTHLALAVQPGLAHYGGMSGVLHGGVAVAALHLVRRGRARAAWLGAALLAGLAVRVLLDAPWGAPLRPALGGSFVVAPLAHAAGAVTGAICAVLALARGEGGAPR